MDTTTLIGSNRLLDHPFYRRWEEGKLEEWELARYASEYRHFEVMLPAFLAVLAERLDDPESLRLVEANLADEIAGPETHLQAFDRFARAVGATVLPASPAMTNLVDLYRNSAGSEDPSFALGVLAGYEVQAAEVAQTKGEGLASKYGVDEEGCAFWEIHAQMERDHAEWTLLAAERGDIDAFIAGALASSSAWWQFLDQCELLVAA